MKDFAAGLKIIDAAAPIINQHGCDQTTHLSVDASAVTISLNTPAEQPLNDIHFKLAAALDQALKP